ncbi:MAG TPA: ABC transporter ATP-binding protein [Gaiellaceae bacterium]|nr:ABC transporter ATP-binding protein [Gaiellaceae bacterium]
MSGGQGPLLRTQGLTKEFGSGRTLVRAVRGVDLTVDAGEILLIEGPSGAGKTTLLTMIGALLRPTSGRVVIDGLDVTALGQRELPAVRRRSVGFVFQTFNLLETLTAQENVEVALNVAGVSGAAAHARARELLVGAGLEQRLDLRVRGLSGGERQRVSIARALANRPRLLLADEPTANLDSRHGRDVMQLLRELAKEEGCGVVIVSHDGRLRRIADRVLTLEDGRIVGADAPDDRPPRPVSGARSG